MATAISRATTAKSAVDSAVATPQRADGVTYAKKISPRFTRLDWTKPGAVLDGKIRGLSPFPGAWFELPTDKGPVRVKALLSAFEDEAGERYWVYRAGDGEDPATGSHRWFLHGIFG